MAAEIVSEKNFFSSLSGGVPTLFWVLQQLDKFMLVPSSYKLLNSWKHLFRVFLPIVKCFSLHLETLYSLKLGFSILQSNCTISDARRRRTSQSLIKASALEMVIGGENDCRFRKSCFGVCYYLIAMAWWGSTSIYMVKELSKNAMSSNSL